MKPHRIAVFVRDGVLPMELGFVHQIFGQARSANGEPLYQVVTCALQAGPVRANADFTITARRGVQTLTGSDTVIFPAAHNQDMSGRPLSVPLAAAIGRIRPGTRIASICTGAFVLAAAGLLDHRRATTHWRAAELFRRRYPDVVLDPDVMYVDEGDVLTSAGAAAGIDLCLHMIRNDHGPSVANGVAWRTVVAPHRAGGQAPFIRRPAEPQRSSATGVAQAWALEHLHRPLTLGDLAGRASLSTRTFSRQFRAEVGVSPLQWLIQQRVDRARHLLEETDADVDEIAVRVGFGSATCLRTHFSRHVHVSPSSYRATFRGRATRPAARRSAPMQPAVRLPAPRTQPPPER